MGQNNKHAPGAMPPNAAMGAGGVTPILGQQAPQYPPPTIMPLSPPEAAGLATLKLDPAQYIAAMVPAVAMNMGLTPTGDVALQITLIIPRAALAEPPSKLLIGAPVQAQAQYLAGHFRIPTSPVVRFHLPKATLRDREKVQLVDGDGEPGTEPGSTPTS